MKKKIFYLFSYVLLFFIISTTIISLMLTKAEALRYLGDKYLKPQGVAYSSIKGSLFGGITLKNVIYKNKFKAKKLNISYHILQLYKNKNISQVLINDAVLYLDNLPAKQNNKAILPPFGISKIKIKNLKIIKNSHFFTLNGTISDIKYSKTFEAKTINLSLKYPKYLTLKLNGSFHNDTLKAQTKIYPDKSYLKRFEYYPKDGFSANLIADKNEAKITSKIKKVNFKKFDISRIALNANYSFSSNKINFSTLYKIKKDKFIFDIKQDGDITTKGNFLSLANVTVINTPMQIPFKKALISFKGDTKKITATLKAKSNTYKLQGDYKSFHIAGSTKYKNFDFATDSFLCLSPFKIDGNVTLSKQKNIYKSSFVLTKKVFKSDTDILQNNHSFTLQTVAKDFDFKKDIKVGDLNFLIYSKLYGRVKFRGKLDQHKLLGKAKLYPKKKYLASLQNYPYPIVADIKADSKKVMLTTVHNDIKIKNLDIKELNLSSIYTLNSNFLDLNATYKANIKKNTFSINQKAKLFFDGKLNSTLNAHILHSPLPLPFKMLKAKIKADTKHIVIDANAGRYKVRAKGDYKRYTIFTRANDVTFVFLDNLPNVLKHTKTTLFLKTKLNFTNKLNITGILKANNKMGKLDAKYHLTEKNQLLKAIFYPNKNYKLWENHYTDKISPMNVTLFKDEKSKVLNVDAKLLNITLFKKADTLGGWGNVASASFSIKGKTDKKGVFLKADANLPSIKNFIKDTKIAKFDKNSYFDAKADINSTLNISKNIVFKSTLYMPWFEIKLDQKHYEGKNFSITSTITDTNAIINKYSFYILNHHIYSNKTSKISFSKDGQIIFKKLYIFDTLLLTGDINPLKKEGILHINGKNFHYISKDADIRADANLTAIFKNDGTQKFTGKVTLLGGTVKYKPKNDYTLIDNDIIIIQNIHANRSSKRSVNVFVEAKKPIIYKTKDISFKFVPDFLIYQEEGNPLQYLGMVSIKSGKVTKGGKTFKIQKSAIYLRGATPINPYLNLHFLYQANDNTNIKIYIENTLASPLILLSSNPPMSQNDIMSYILFGKPANSNFKSSNGSISLNPLLYGVGIKKMFQDTTHVNIDTLNILTTKDKRLGYEIGMNLNDKIRVIYKNDTISSIIIQYSLNRAIQLDINVKQSGEGVNILYTKDF